MKAADNIEVLEMMETMMPKKYCEQVIMNVKLGIKSLFGNGSLTMKDVYEAISRKIWLEDTDFRTKLRLYGILNDAMFAVMGWT